MSGLTTQVSITQEPTLCGHDYSQSETVIVTLEFEGLSASPRIDALQNTAYLNIINIH